MFRKILLSVIILAAGVGTFSYLKSTRAIVNAELPKERTWAVKTIRVSPQQHQNHIVALGVVTAGRTAILRSEVPGKLVALSPNFRDGAVLTKGTQLLDIESFYYDLAHRDALAAEAQAKQRLEQLRAEQKGQQAQLKEANQNRELSAKEVRRQTSLNQQGLSARNNLDAAQRSLNAATQNTVVITSAIQSLESQIQQQQRAIERAQLGVTRAERDLAATRITTPFDGFLTQPNAALGQQVSTNDRLGQLIAADQLEIKFSLSEADFAALQGPKGKLLNKSVRVTWSPGPSPEHYQAVITRQAAQTMTASGSIELFASLSEPDISLPLRPGMFVTVEIAEIPLEEAIAVPEEALVDGTELYAVKPDEKGDLRLALVDFKLLSRRNGMAYLQTSLQPGTEVVTHTFPQIIQGLKVSPYTDSPGNDTNTNRSVEQGAE